jgi:hypothetical protein
MIMRSSLPHITLLSREKTRTSKYQMGLLQAPFPSAYVIFPIPYLKLWYCQHSQSARSPRVFGVPVLCLIVHSVANHQYIVTRAIYPL